MMMDLRDSAFEAASLRVCGPLLERKIAATVAMGKEALMDGAVKAELADSAAAMGISDAVFKSVAMKAYAKQVEDNPPVMGKSGSLQARQDLLDATRFFLDLGDREWGAVEELHNEAALPTFDKAVQEAVTAGAGVVGKEYSEGLSKLGGLLMLSGDLQAARLLEALKERLKAKAARLLDSLEQKVLSKEEYAKRKGRDQVPSQRLLSLWRWRSAKLIPCLLVPHPRLLLTGRGYECGLRGRR